MKGSMEQNEKGKTAEKKPYAKPELIRYGSVAELTKGGGNSTNDTLSKRKGG